MQVSLPQLPGIGPIWKPLIEESFADCDFLRADASSGDSSDYLRRGDRITKTEILSYAIFTGVV